MLIQMNEKLTNFINAIWESKVNINITFLIKGYSFQNFSMQEY